MSTVATAVKDVATHRPTPVRGEKDMKKKSTPLRRGTDMVYSSDPIIPMRVETLLSDINRKMDDVKSDVNRKMDDLNKNISTLRESMHTKADKSDVDKLESRVDDIQRNGSDVAKRVASEVTNELTKKVAALELSTAQKVAVETNERRLGEVNDRQDRFWIGQIAGWVLAIAAILVAIFKH